MVCGKKSSDDAEMQVTNPATEIAISKVPVAGKREVDFARMMQLDSPLTMEFG